MFAVLDFWDFFWIWCVVTLALTLYAGGRAAYARSRLAMWVRVRRLEAKVDLILGHFGLEYKDPATPAGLSEEVKALAENPADKIAAIALHREQTGLGLKEAKDAVESYMAGRR
jgi:Ribosomal protein L7/L12 C-terminal domain